MKNYQLNSLQFHVLPVALKKSQAEMARELGMSHTVLNKRLKSGDFRIVDLLRICNRYHIRLSSLITTDETAAFGADVIVKNDEWHDIHFSARKFVSAMERGEILKKDITRCTRFSHNTIGSVLSEESQVSRILHLCNMMSLNLTDFFNDSTLPQIIPESTNLRRQNEELKAELEALRSELAQQRSINRSLRMQLTNTHMVAED